MSWTARCPEEILPGGPGEWLADEMAAAWEQGACLPAEHFLACHPELRDQPEAAVRLIYEEVCLRQERGEAVETAELLARFPAWTGELAVLFDCHQLVGQRLAPPPFPEAGERVGDFRLICELGRGAHSRVFLARQAALADRPVVLKVTLRQDRECLSLARLQHTHIIPLHGVYDFPDRELRALCEPYLGGATLAQILDRLRPVPPGERTGVMIVEALDAAASLALPAARGPRQMLARMAYADAVCWIGACLADGLHHAHERGLLHLDLKPSNVLLAADGQPMLLDFHLALPPVAADCPAPDGLGGTPEYMSPEQRGAYEAARSGRVVPSPIDARSDVYSLGRLLHHTLSGDPRVSPGLADIIDRCLASSPANRYPSAAAVAADLRRHLANQPLRGVANRSLRERWRKWRRRRPHAPLWAGLLLALLAVPILLGAALFDGLRDAQSALDEGRRQTQRGAHTAAITTLERGKARLATLPYRANLDMEIDAWLTRAQRAESAAKLHAVCERLRFVPGTESLSTAERQTLDAQCRAAWEASADLTLNDQSRADLIDLVVFWTDLHIQASPADILAEAEARCGPSAALSLQRRSLRGDAERGPAPTTFRDHAALGRVLLRSGDLDRAARELATAQEMRPQDFWVNFDAGVCAHRRGAHADAVNWFSVAVALAPDRAEAYHNRALAHAAARNTTAALRDCDHALKLAPHLAAALLNRGVLRHQAGRHTEALSDLKAALHDGAAPATTHYNLALVYLALRDPAAAQSHVEQALRHEPRHAGALALRQN